MLFVAFIQRHINIFPNVSFKQELNVVCTEHLEFKKAKNYNNKISELLDIAVAAIGVMRFDKILGEVIFNGIWTTLWIEFSDKVKDFDEFLQLELNKKFDKLEKRLWVKDEKLGYHHVSPKKICRTLNFPS